MIKEVIEKKLSEALSPEYLEVINESYMHNVPKGSESHFKVTVVSVNFDNQRLIARHRTINQILTEELSHHIHALSMHTYTPQEWQAQNEKAPDSPKCLGGSK